MITYSEVLNQPQKTLGIIGGGLSGIAAADVAAAQGNKVVLFERSRVLGGRSSSLFEPLQQHWIDTGQHVLLGCCIETLALNRRLGLDRFFEKIDAVPFAHIKSRRWSLTPSSYLPGRWKLLCSFLTMPQLSLTEKIKTGRLLRKLCSETVTSGTILEWFQQNNVSDAALETFWAPLILGALSELPDYVEVAAVQKVIRESLMHDAEKLAIYLPTVPLRTIYHDAALQSLTSRSVECRFFKRLRYLHWEKKANESLPTITALEFSDGTTEQFDRYLLAIPVFQLGRVLEASGLDCLTEKLGQERFEPCAITTLHLWLDRRVLETGKRCCVLSGGVGQFLCTFDQQNDHQPHHQPLHYHTVVISAAHRLLTEAEMTMQGNGDLAHRVLDQLRQTFGITELQCRHCRTTTCFEAVFSPTPKIFSCRPASTGFFANGTVAGDWTQTGFPATMEGAVRSGLKAAKER